MGHQKAAHPREIREPVPLATDFQLRRKSEALRTGNLTWDQIYDICFRDEPDRPVTGIAGARGHPRDNNNEEDN